MRLKAISGQALGGLVLFLLASTGPLSRPVVAESPTGLVAGLDEAAAERGRVAMTLKGFLKPAWSEGAYRNAGRLWDQPAPDPDTDPKAYAALFRYRYGLHPAPFPNDGLPLGLRRGISPEGVKSGLQIDCMVCHGGSIGGQSYVGLGNTQLDIKALLYDLTFADGKSPAAFHVRAQLVTRYKQCRPDRRGVPEPSQLRSLVSFVPLATRRQLSRNGHTSVVAHEAQADHVLRRPDRRPLDSNQHAVPLG